MPKWFRRWLISHSENWFRQCRNWFRDLKVCSAWKQKRRGQTCGAASRRFDLRRCYFDQTDNETLFDWHHHTALRFKAILHHSVFNFERINFFHQKTSSLNLNYFLQWPNQFSEHETNLSHHDANFCMDETNSQFTKPISLFTKPILRMRKQSSTKPFRHGL